MDDEHDDPLPQEREIPSMGSRKGQLLEVFDFLFIGNLDISANQPSISVRTGEVGS